MTEDEMVGWHHQFHGHEFEQVWKLVMNREAWHTAVDGVTYMVKYTYLFTFIIIHIYIIMHINSVKFFFSLLATGKWKLIFYNFICTSNFALRTQNKQYAVWGNYLLQNGL